MLTTTAVFRTLSTLGLAALFAAACNTGTPVPEQTLDVACAMCIYKKSDVGACVWAADVAGEQYLVQSPHLPKDHKNHAPDGMCNMTRQAVIAGDIRGDRLVASKFELLPAQTSKVPEKPTFEVDEEH